MMTFQVRLLPGLPRLPREDGGERGGDRPVRTREEQVQRRLEAEPGQHLNFYKFCSTKIYIFLKRSYTLRSISEIKNIFLMYIAA